MGVLGLVAAVSSVCILRLLGVELKVGLRPEERWRFGPNAYGITGCGPFGSSFHQTGESFWVGPAEFRVEWR